MKETSTSVVRKRSSSSSGCLIIKKKAVIANDDSSCSRNLFKSSSNNNNKKKKKRIRSDSESSDNSSEIIRQQKIDNGNKGEIEKKVSNGLDVFEFDEYDAVNDNDVHGKYSNWNLFNSHQIQKGSRNKTNSVIRHDDDDDDDDDVVDDDDHDDDDESDLPLSVFIKKSRLSSHNKPNSRLQEKNGVVKVMVNKNKQKKLNKDEDKSKDKLSRKQKVTKNEDFVKKPKLKSKSKQSEEVNGIKESGVSRTEKKILREKIKEMLLAADWTIDYRKRKNKDYLDAVYITPSGTAYWSIVKAYETLQKEQIDDFTPLPDETLGKLTRQTRKKIEVSDRCSLLVRGFEPYYGKRTILSWLIDSGVVNMNEHVEFINPKEKGVLKKGRITKDGICCGCCNRIVTVVKFGAHAGSKGGEMFENMFLGSGKSLLECQIDAWEKQGELERNGFYGVNDDDDDDDDDGNDDTCGLCGDGGDLICCDGCPSTFHETCLDIEMVPEGDWHCPNCSCKYCTQVTEASLATCGLCQKKYHESCKPEVDKKSSYPNLSFCGHHCHQLYSGLQKLVGVKHELDSGFSWSFINRSHLLKDASSSQRVECNSKLALAMSVMDECFLPFTDTRSGTNLIRNVVFNCGSNLSRLNYTGFCTAILEREDEMVCAASIRIQGKQAAEMPFIGTRHIYRRQGMCRRLLSAIETALSSLEVEKLIIPAVTEHMNTWTDVFGFQPLEESHKQELKSMNMLVFPGTDMLQKPLVKQSVPQGNDIVKEECTAFSEKSELISSEVKTDSGCSVKNINDDIPCEEGVIDDAHFVDEKPIEAPNIVEEEIIVQNGCDNAISEHQQLQSSDDDVIPQTQKHAQKSQG